MTRNLPLFLTFCRIPGTLGSALAVLILALAGPLAAEGPWPGWLGPQRDGHSADVGLAKSWPTAGPKLLWKVDCLGPGWSSVAVVGQRVYITGNVDEQTMLFCFDSRGKELWRAAQGPQCSHKGYPGTRATPVVDGNRIYLVGGNGRITCQDTADGHILWQRDMKDFGGRPGGWLWSESVLILGDRAIVTPGGKHPVVALDKATGKEIWQSDFQAVAVIVDKETGKETRKDVPVTAGYSSCIAIEDQGSTIIVNGSQSGLLAVDAKTGAKIWTDAFASPNTANVPTPAYADGYLFWSVGYGKGSACYKVTHSGDRWTFKPAWTSKDMGCHPGNYVVANGRVYGKGRGLACLDLKTGATLWTEGSVPAGQVCWADGMLYTFSDSGGRACLVEPSASRAKVAGKMQVAGTGSSWAHPVVAGGRLYLRYETNLYCFDAKEN